MSAPQHIGGRAPTGRLSGVREQTCRLPSKLSLGSRHRSAVWRSGADLSAPQQIVVGEPTGRFPRTLPLGARHVGSLDTAVSIAILRPHSSVRLRLSQTNELRKDIYLRSLPTRFE